MIGLHERAVAVEDAEAVGIAVGGEASERFLFNHQLLQRREIFFGRVGAGAVEKHVTLGANGFDGHAVVGEDAIEPARAAAVYGVIGEIAFGFGEDVEANHFFQLREVWAARIKPLEIVCNVLEGGFVVRQCGRALFDVFGDFRQRGAAVGAGEFQAIVFGRVVAGGDVDAAIEFIVDDGVGQDRSRRRFRAENDAAAIFPQDTRGGTREFRRKEARVMADNERRDFSFALTCPAMAAEARRTPAKVKSSAITPRQPEVPKWIVCFVTGDYCILACETKSRKNCASRKSKGVGGWR